VLSGSIVALVTPLRDGSLDEEGLRKNIRFQMENGTSALVPCGTTGESPALSSAEWERVISITVEEAQGRLPVIAGTGTNSTDRTIEATSRARELGATGALVVTPYYNRPTQEGLYGHYKKVAEEGGLPIVLYNVPSRTGVNLESETVFKLSRLEGIVALKEASGNLTQASEIISECSGQLDLLSGDDALTLPLLALGASGVISVAANIVPSDMAMMISYFTQGRLDEARGLHQKLTPLFKALFLRTNPIPVKSAMSMLGMPAGEPRLPLTRMAKDDRDLLKAVLTDYGLELNSDYGG
jgi:4-hydroxy-tetrahydrodipicolinate synthase